MYSLYRAWLSLGPAALPPLPAALPPNPLDLVPQAHMNGSPDVTLHVGPSMTHFSAHKTVLSAHSGFFKAALSTHPGNLILLNKSKNAQSALNPIVIILTGALTLVCTELKLSFLKPLQFLKGQSLIKNR